MGRLRRRVRLNGVDKAREEVEAPAEGYQRCEGMQEELIERGGRAAQKDGEGAVS